MSDRTLMTCEEALRLLALYLDGELPTGAQAGVERHLELCRSCYSRAEFERRLKAEVARLRKEPVPASFEEHIRRLLHSFAPSPAGEPADGS